MALELLRRLGRRAVRHLRAARLDRWLASAERRRVLALIEESQEALRDANMPGNAKWIAAFALLDLRSRILQGDSP